jgi:hypothetical protein
MIEAFEGMMTGGIWQRLAIEEKVNEMQAGWKEITAKNVVKELTDEGNVVEEISADELVETCDYYLQRYNDPFADLGFVPDDIKWLTESGRDALLKAVTIKSKLYKAHAAELDAYVKSVFGNSG